MSAFASKEECLQKLFEWAKPYLYSTDQSEVNDLLDKVGNDLSLIKFEDDLQFDELDKIEFVMDIESELDIEMDDDDVDSVSTLGDMADLVMKLTA